MQFIVSDVLDKEASSNEWILLLRDNWNDWFTYKTLFSVYYCVKSEKPQWLGNIKIGFLGDHYYEEDSFKLPDIPDEFPCLPEHFFSLGQDVEYYKALNSLAEDKRVEILKSLRDIAFDSELFIKCRREDVTKVSLLRSVAITSVKGQFRRLSQGNSELTSFQFKYSLPNNEIDSYLEVSVTPKQVPPNNIHVVIGRNGVGKTYLLSNLIDFLTTRLTKYGNLEHLIEGSENNNDIFANLIAVSFSAFDLGFNHKTTELIKFESIGWTLTRDKISNEFTFVEVSSKMFLKSLKVIKSNGRTNRWKLTIDKLNSDPMFKKSRATNLINFIDEDEKYIRKVFGKLSSGHKIVLLTLTQLIEKVEERSLIVLDEPELHLHPPLLSAFTRALSDLLIYRNAVAIIATHSPVILQEVPKKCVTIIDRISRSNAVNFHRPQIETFGNNVGVLTSEVFNLEVTDSGFHSILKGLVGEYETLDEILEVLDGQLAFEGMSILISLLNQKNKQDGA